MEHCYNMMTIMNNIRTTSIKLSMLGVGVLFMGVFYLLHNGILTSVGYMTTSILSFILVCMINRIDVVMSTQPSIHTLKLENDDLTMTINIKKNRKIYKRRYGNAEIYNGYCR